MSSEHFGLVIVAGGQGTRMGGDVPKPLIKLEGREVLLRSLDAFQGTLPIKERVVVFPKAIIRELFGGKKQRNFPTPDAEHPLVAELARVGVNECVCGGERRQDSVLRGAKALSDDCKYLLVHDAVRPFVQREDIDALIAGIRDDKAGSLATAVTDTLRKRESNEFLDRDALAAMQTPQGGPRAALIDALEAAGDTTYTDDLSAFAAAGLPTFLVMASKSNIKLTTPEDLAFAAFMLAQAKNA